MSKIETRNIVIYPGMDIGERQRYKHWRSEGKGLNKNVFLSGTFFIN